VSRGKGGSLTFVGLIALIVATGVFSVLYFLVAFNTRKRARRTSCCSNLHSFTLALVQYTNDWNGDLPAVPGVVKSSTTKPGSAPEGSGEESLGLLFEVYVPEIRVFWCASAPPGEADRIGYYSYPPSLAASGGWRPSFREQDHCSFAYDPRHHSAHKPGVALVADRGGGEGVNSPNHQFDGQNVLYLDGHVKWWARTDCGYGGDEIYIRNDEMPNPRNDSWLVNSRPGGPPEWFVRREAAFKRRIFALLFATLAAAALPPVVFLVMLARRRRKNGANHQDTKNTKNTEET